MDCRREELLPSMAYQPALAYQSFQRVVQESKRIFIPSPTQPQLLDWLPQVPSPWPTSHTLYQLSSTIKWYGWEHGKDIQESDCKGNPVRPTMVFFPPGVQSYTVNKQFQQKYYLADNSDPTFPPSPHSSLTPELHTSVKKLSRWKTNSTQNQLQLQIFVPGQPLWQQDPLTKKWSPGAVHEKIQEQHSYSIASQGTTYRRNRNHLKSGQVSDIPASITEHYRLCYLMYFL